MKYAFDTIRDVIRGDRDLKVQAILTFGLWFCAGAFAVSTFQYYFLSHESAVFAAVGGLAVSSIVAVTKLS